MRVGIFSECYHPIRNGVVASIDALCDGLRALGHEALVVAPAAGAAQPPPNVRVPSLPLPTRTAYRLVLPLLDSRKRARVKSFSVIHTHSPFVTGWMGVRYARRFGVPLVFTYHTQLEEYAHYVPFERKTTQRAASTLTRRYANLADTVIVPTSPMETRLRELGVTAPIAVVATGIDVDRFAQGRRDAAWLREAGVPGEARVVLAVSRLAREKNLELAIAAIARAGERTHLVLAGDGPERASLAAAARQAGVADRVHFLGHVERTRLPDLYASADTFAFTSHTETQGLVLAEALAAGLTVVAVDTPATRDVLGGAGILVEGDPSALADGVRAALAASGEKYSAAHLALRRFSLESYARRIVDIYQALLEERRTA